MGKRQGILNLHHFYGVLSLGAPPDGHWWCASHIPLVGVSAIPQLAGTQVPGDISEMCSFSVDAWFDDPSLLTDEHRLLTAMRDAAAAGNATVMGEASALFPNGAVTAALLLAESHLTVHTWPEHGLARFDLLTCGRLHGEVIVAHLMSRLAPTRSRVDSHIRHLP